MDIARRSIELTEDFLFNKLGLQSTLTEIGIDSRNFDIGRQILPWGSAKGVQSADAGGCTENSGDVPVKVIVLSDVHANIWALDCGFEAGEGI